MTVRTLIKIASLAFGVSTGTICRHTYGDVLEVLTQFGRAGHHLPLGNPLLQLVHLPVELVEPVLLLQAALPLLHQVLQGHVEPVDLRLALADLLAARRGRDAAFKLYG